MSTDDDTQTGSINGYNCGKHEKRNQPHWDGKHWCNGKKKREES